MLYVGEYTPRPSRVMVSGTAIRSSRTSCGSFPVDPQPHCTLRRQESAATSAVAARASTIAAWDNASTRLPHPDVERVDSIASPHVCNICALHCRTCGNHMYDACRGAQGQLWCQVDNHAIAYPCDTLTDWTGRLFQHFYRLHGKFVKSLYLLHPLNLLLKRVCRFGKELQHNFGEPCGLQKDLIGPLSLDIACPEKLEHGHHHVVDRIIVPTFSKF